MRRVLIAGKLVWLLFCATVMTIFIVIPIHASAMLSRTGNLPFTFSKIWARAMLMASFTRVSVRGRENIEAGRSHVIIANHQSLYDILAIVTTLGIQFRWIIKKEILRIPLFGYALLKSRNIFIDRSDPERARQSISEGVARLPEGVSLLVFAEGTRSEDGRLQEFKKGGFVIAIDHQFPILPITVNGSRRVMPRNSLVFTPGRIEVIIGKPIDTRGATRGDIEGIISRTRNTIEANLSLD